MLSKFFSFTVLSTLLSLLAECQGHDTPNRLPYKGQRLRSIFPKESSSQQWLYKQISQNTALTGYGDIFL